MKRAGVAAVIAAAVIGGVSTAATAALCGGGPPNGFTDVQDTDIFCNATLWLKNRLITTGCGDGTTYCPNEAVSRASMALFLNRTGKALTPAFSSRQGSTGTGSTIPAGQFIPFCQTPATDIPAVNYPRQLRARGTISAVLSGSAIGLSLFRSFNGGPLISIVETAELFVGNPSGDQVLHWSSNVVPVPPGNSVSVALGLINRGGGSLTLATNGRCAIEVEVFNANPTTPPFDEPD